MGVLAAALDLINAEKTAQGAFPRPPIGGNNVSEQSNLYNDNHEYEEQEHHASRTRKKKKRRGGAARTVLKVLGTLLLIGICTGALLCCFAAVYIQTVILPQATLDLGTIDVNENSVMYYQDKSTGEYKELVTMLAEEDTTWISYEELPEDLINAAVAIEDQRFWTHKGVDWKRTAAAVFYMFTGRDIQGGSTITQQLIKNITEYDDVTVKRKVIEIFKALEFDKTYGKETTLEWYLNYIWLGSGCRGVGSASYKYFGKPVQELTLAECASLISITNNPSIYGPYSDLKMDKKLSTGEVVQWDSRQWNKWRQENVLFQMLDQGYITQEEYDQAVAQELVFVLGEEEKEATTIYSWYEEQVRSDVIAALMDKYQINSEAASHMLKTGGLKIYTCLDPDVQAQVEEIYNNEENLNYYSSSGEHLQSAITVIDNATGNLVGIAGSLGKKTVNLGFNMASEAKRQPGSSIKPLAVYAPAIDMGLISPITILDDYPHEVLGGKAWPVNVDGVYRGLVSVREALANSYNTVSVRVLADLVTPAKGFEYAHDKFHLSTLVEARQGSDQIYTDIAVSPLATGGLTDGTNTRDMAVAFAVFPNNGIYRTPRTYTRVENSQGDVILENEQVSEIAVTEDTAYYMNSLLRSVVTSGGGTAANFNSGMAIAGKTGTTDSKKDRWFVGYTPYYTAAVWVGYAKTPERVPASGNPALNMWKLVMSGLHEGLENKQFNQPSSALKSVTVCKDSGLIATEYCALDARVVLEGKGSRVLSDSVFARDVPSGYCTIHTAESTLTICVDDPILDDNGNPTGHYHLAGEFCPEESRRQVSYLNYDREDIGGARANDSSYLYAEAVAAGPCTVHTSEWQDDPEQPGYDPFDPSTWPSNPTVDPDDPGGSNPVLPPDDNEEPGGSTPVDPGINPETGLPYGL